MTIRTGIYASDRDFADGVIISRSHPQPHRTSHIRSVSAGRRDGQRQPGRLGIVRPKRTAPATC
ncbi:hypothetical protein ABID26_004688 [Mesorhizobium shonense]|uniref:Uncharacterized protein n=1 Tax=Mesorhizobium shonense TaxID=1209948 RepID=A0ABV2HXH5_9HYPH